MRFYKVINNKTKEVCLTAQINETTLGGINYKDQPLSSIEQLLELAGDNFTDLDNIALPLLNSTKFKINLEDLISSSKEKSGLFRMCQPYTPTEIWAAGVTYKSSELERKRESDTPDVYAKVYNSKNSSVSTPSLKKAVIGSALWLTSEKQTGPRTPSVPWILIIFSFKNFLITELH